jgi:hypothetical protein
MTSSVKATGDGPFAREVPKIAIARTCYDHLAGRLGVALFCSLVSSRAILDVNATTGKRKVRSGLGEVRLGSRAHSVFESLGIDLDETAAERRQFATACSDWTELQPHLGGALGAALQSKLLRQKWILRRAGTRAIHVTALGWEQLAQHFAIDRDLVKGSA